MSELPNPAPEASPNIHKASEILIEWMVLLGGFSAENNKVRASTSSCSLGDVIAMSLVYYSRDIGVKSLALYFIE
jgi:hypothetical protein